MSSGTVAVRYAKALLKYAEENGCQAEVYDKMNRLAACIRTVPQIMDRLKDPTVSDSDKSRLLVTAAAECDGKPVGKALENFLELVVRSGRCESLIFIAHSYRVIYRAKYNVLPVELSTATSVDDAQRTELMRFIESKTDDTLEWREKVDPSLMGGFVLQVSDYRLDASVARRLRIIEKELIEKNSRII